MALKNVKFKYKLLLLPALSCLVFAQVVAVVQFYNGRNASNLGRIQKGLYPAVEASRNMENTLDEIQRTLQNAVASQETAQISTADSIADVFHGLISASKENPANSRSDLARLDADFRKYYSLARDISIRMIGGVMDQQTVGQLNEMRDQYNAIRRQLETNTAVNRKAISEAFDVTLRNHAKSRNILILLVLLAAALLILLSRVITNLITGPIFELVDGVKTIAQGDLTKRVNIDAKDETGELAGWFNKFAENLHGIISQVKSNTESVASAAGIISLTSNKMAASAQDHNNHSGEVASSVEEMTSSIMQNSQNAGQTAKIAEEAGSKARLGTQAMQETLKGMDEIVLSTQKMGGIIQSLSSRVLQVDEITRVIDKIADQTNLLALNAAIEAARAGEEGSGFAVVADEVRKLAERTTEATKRIASTIEAIQTDTVQASESMNTTKTVVVVGKAAAEKTEKVLAEILDVVARATDMIQQIAAASEEQSSGAEEISCSVEEMNAVSKQSAEGAEELADVVQALSRQTENLKKSIVQFKLNN